MTSYRYARTLKKSFATKHLHLLFQDLLAAVRDVNPMFEENIQQDAPEFLHCLLMYVQEASKQIFKLKDILSPPKPLLLMPVDDDNLEDDQDSKSDKSDAPSTSSGYDSGVRSYII